MGKNNEEQEMLAQSQLLEMGWTKSMINKLLPDPQLRTNPFYKCAAPMKLWERKIAEVYPDYAEECKRQMEFMPI